MTPKFLVLVVVALSLVACETTGIKAPIATRVVRMAPIPDEPEARSAKPRVQPVAASASAVLAAPRKPATALAKTTTGETTIAAAASVEAAPVVPAPSDILPSELAPSEPGRIEATPVTAGGEKPAASGFEISAIPGLIKAMIGGMPLWLIALIGAVILAALALGMWGGRKPRDPYSHAEPETA